MLKDKLLFAASTPVTPPPPVLEGSLWGWARNNVGQRAYFLASDNTTPVQSGTDTNWKMVIASGAPLTSLDEPFSLGIKTDGTLWSWGSNHRGQTGLSLTSSYIVFPTQVGTDSDWAFIGEGAYHSVAIKENGTLWSWGFNGEGATGQGLTSGNTTVPTQVGTDTDWLKAEAGCTPNTNLSFTLALKTNGTLWAWGSNNLGQTGLGTGSGNNLTPTQIGSDTWLDVAAGARISFGVKTNGTLWTWGSNQDYGTGLGDNTGSTLSPTQNGVATDWFAVGRGNQNGFALKGAGELWSWGGNSNGVTGHAGGTIQNPTRVGSASDWIRVTSTLGEPYYFAQGLRSDGTAWGWGSNFQGRNGTGILVTPPTQLGVDTNWLTVSAGLSHSMAIRSV